ncbi:hypothetical protein O9992_15055 [Vibrio lentus]|nr:hypothetical protein [Vibrio lentus]
MLTMSLSIRSSDAATLGTDALSRLNTWKYWTRASLYLPSIRHIAFGYDHGLLLLID